MQKTRRTHLVIIITFLAAFMLTVNCNGVEAEGIITGEVAVSKNLPEFTDKASLEFKGIQIKVMANEDGVVYGFEIEGRSNEAERGKDMAGVTIASIAQSTLLSLQSYTTDRVFTDIKEGYIKCSLPDLAQNKGSVEACVLLKSAVMGFYLIEQSDYGKNQVKVYRWVENK